MSLCNIDSFNEHCNFLVANPDTPGAELSQLLPEVSRFKIHHLGGILQLLMLCDFLRKSSSIFAFFGSWWHQNQFTHKIYFVCLLIYSYESEFQYSTSLPSTQKSFGKGDKQTPCAKRVKIITQNRVMNFVHRCYEFFVSIVSFSVNGPSLCCEKQKKIETRP